MQLRLLEFAEYAAQTDDGKIVIGGIFTGITSVRLRDPDPGSTDVLGINKAVLVWIVEASLQDGLAHRAGLRVLDGNGNVVVEMPDLGPMNFILNPQGRPMRFQGRLDISGLVLPGADEYVFELIVDGSKLGEVNLFADVADHP